VASTTAVQALAREVARASLALQGMEELGLPPYAAHDIADLTVSIADMRDVLCLLCDEEAERNGSWSWLWAIYEGSVMYSFLQRDEWVEDWVWKQDPKIPRIAHYVPRGYSSISICGIEVVGEPLYFLIQGGSYVRCAVCSMDIEIPSPYSSPMEE